MSNFFLVTSRTSLAFVTAHEDGNLTYTNRRGETMGLSDKAAVKLYTQGYTTENAREVGPNGLLVKTAKTASEEMNEALEADHAAIAAELDEAALVAKIEEIDAELAALPVVLTPAEKGKITKARNKAHAEALLLNV